MKSSTQNHPHRSLAALDRTAMLMSTVCLVHCLALPLVLALLPFAASSLFAHEHFHRWILLAVVPSSLLALVMGCRHHRNWRVALFGAAGLAALSIAAFGPMSQHLETLVSVSGALMLAAAHLVNLRLHRRSHAAASTGAAR